jgi:hypothetical protein
MDQLISDYFSRRHQRSAYTFYKDLGMGIVTPLNNKAADEFYVLIIRKHLDIFTYGII